MNSHGEAWNCKKMIHFDLCKPQLAAHTIGGLKVGVGFSLCKCRMCLATADQLSTKVSWLDYSLALTHVSWVA